MPRIPSPPAGLTEAAPFPPDCAEKFEFVRRLGGGGFGAVFLAIHRDLRVEVAIKLLLDDLLEDTAQVQRFNDEARITAALSHPNVVRAIDFGAAHGIPWLALELVPGTSLRDRLDAGNLPREDAVAAVVQVARALDAAHTAGVLHRDVKPDNVLSAAPGVWKVTDFGIARWARERSVKTATGVILGTPTYIAPELVLGEAATPASDIYALGVMLHEVLTGVPPYRSEHLGVLLEQHVNAAIPRPSTIKPSVAAALDEVVVRALAKRPEQRHRSGEELAMQLEAATQAGATAGSGTRPRTAPRAGERPEANTRRVTSRRPALDVPVEPPRAKPRWAIGTIAALVAVAAAAWLGFRPQPVQRPIEQSSPRVPSPSPSAPPAETVERELARLRALAAHDSQLRDHQDGLFHARENLPNDLDTATSAEQESIRRRLVSAGAGLRNLRPLLRTVLEEHGDDARLLTLEPVIDGAVDQAGSLLANLTVSMLANNQIGRGDDVVRGFNDLRAELDQPRTGRYVETLRRALRPHLEARRNSAHGFNPRESARRNLDAESQLAQVALREHREQDADERAVSLCFLLQASHDLREASGWTRASGAPSPARVALHAQLAEVRARAYALVDRVSDDIDALRARDPRLVMEGWVRLPGPWIGTLFLRVAQEHVELATTPAERLIAVRKLLLAARGVDRAADIWWDGCFTAGPEFHNVPNILREAEQDGALAVTPDERRDLFGLVVRYQAELSREHFEKERPTQAELSYALRLLAPYEAAHPWARVYAANLRQKQRR